ncbi:hypothetical protein FA13DRAFT_1733877 [Coprinellus micaceus]|uniref:Uncharacterized protein n=1 Tax=Coprinellus micaceus TaxID=71717 RepID=A0A4Y7T7X9_COPMI|nr:hypothetical protein FA13DRAFT_1733877 [Coprinellus micaceus]
MRLRALGLLFLCWAAFALAQSSAVTEQSPSGSSPQTSLNASSSSTRQSLFIPSSTSTSLGSGRPTFSRMGGTSPTPPPGAPPEDPKESRRHPHLAQILFAVLGGLVVVTLLVALARFAILRKRAPTRDREADERDKHILYQEISEMQRNSLIASGRPYNFEPPPVYLPPPPTYDASTTSTVRNSLAATDDGYIGYIPRTDSPPPAGPGYTSHERRNSDNPTLPLLESNQRAGGSNV